MAYPKLLEKLIEVVLNLVYIVLVVGMIGSTILFVLLVLGVAG